MRDSDLSSSDMSFTQDTNDSTTQYLDQKRKRDRKFENKKLN